MEYDKEKLDEMVLALLWLTPAGPRRAWNVTLDGTARAVRQPRAVGNSCG